MSLWNTYKGALRDLESATRSCRSRLLYLKDYLRGILMTNLESELQQFIGGGDVYEHTLGPLLYTEGIKYLAEKVGAYWLIDAVASYQPEQIIRSNPRLRHFQLWRLEVQEDKQARLELREDSHLPPVLTQRIEYTDFPLKEFECFVCDGVLMLKGEY